MNDQGNQGTPFTPRLAEEGDGLFSHQHTARRFLWTAMAIGVALALVLSGWVVFLNLGFPLQPLRADANTLYLADWSKGPDSWSGGPQWYWKQSGVISSAGHSSAFYVGSTTPDDLLFLAPYHPRSADIEVDAQIKSLDWGTTFVGDGPVFGIIIGLDGQHNGYLCGSIWGKSIEHYQDWSDVGITGYSGSTAGDVDFSHYVNFKIKIQRHVLTVFFNGQQVAQATLLSYQAGGSIGVFSAYGAVEVQGFRVEQLP